MSIHCMKHVDSPIPVRKNVSPCQFHLVNIFHVIWEWSVSVEKCNVHIITIRKWLTSAAIAATLLSKIFHIVLSFNKNVVTGMVYFHNFYF